MKNKIILLLLGASLICATQCSFGMLKKYDDAINGTLSYFFTAMHTSYNPETEAQKKVQEYYEENSRKLNPHDKRYWKMNPRKKNKNLLTFLRKKADAATTKVEKENLKTIIKTCENRQTEMENLSEKTSST